MTRTLSKRETNLSNTSQTTPRSTDTVLLVTKARERQGLVRPREAVWFQMLTAPFILVPGLLMLIVCWNEFCKRTLLRQCHAWMKTPTGGLRKPMRKTIETWVNALLKPGDVERGTVVLRCIFLTLLPGATPLI